MLVIIIVHRLWSLRAHQEILLHHHIWLVIIVWVLVILLLLHYARRLRLILMWVLLGRVNYVLIIHLRYLLGYLLRKLSLLHWLLVIAIVHIVAVRLSNVILTHQRRCLRLWLEYLISKHWWQTWHLSHITWINKLGNALIKRLLGLYLLVHLLLIYEMHVWIRLLLIVDRVYHWLGILNKLIL